MSTAEKPKFSILEHYLKIDLLFYNIKELFFTIKWEYP